MHSTMLFWGALAFNLFNFVYLDCGCNKLNRDLNTENSYTNIDKETCKIGKDNLENVPDEMSLIPGGAYQIGTSSPVFASDLENERNVIINDFLLDKYEVSNKDFNKFVEATNFVSETETFNDSFVFKNFLSKKIQKDNEHLRVVNALWWYKISGANWKKPFGPESNLNGLWDHPVVHVSWNDAVAYCKWLNKRLPTEAEWEVACKGGKENRLFPWGNALLPNKSHRMNIWQGNFPDKNTIEDGFEGTCPVKEYSSQNIFDLHNIVGNVWEWTSDLWTKNENSAKNPNRVKKGGSYLCHKSYCYRYRCAARSQNTQDSSAGNLGFRCAKDLEVGS